MLAHSKSKKAFDKAKIFIPGGVDSPVRSFRSVGGTPVFIKSGKGSKLRDIDGNSYIDYCMSWGALILGHAYPAVISKVKKAVDSGTSFGASTELETRLAEMITGFFPSMEQIRFVNSGTEAVMSAVRLARGYSGKNKLIKFDGCYHGHADHLLVNSGSGVSTLPESSSRGVPENFVKDTISLPFNDIAALKRAIEKYGKEIAAVIVEPVPANMGLVLPEEGFLEELRDITIKNGILLIFDEVINGFRIGLGGAQKYYRIKPDLTCLGKIIGGGFPVGAFGGRREIMQRLAPLGDVYQAGTLSGNPVAMSAGIATLEELRKGNFYIQLEKKAGLLAEGFKGALKMAGLKYRFVNLSSMFCLFFTGSEVNNYGDAKKSDIGKFNKYFHMMLESGVYLAPSQFETDFVSFSHASSDVEKTLRICYNVLKKL